MNMRIVNSSDVKVGDFAVLTRNETDLRTEPTLIFRVYRTAVGNQLRVKFNETPLGCHSDSPASMLTIYRKENINSQDEGSN